MSSTAEQAPSQNQEPPEAPGSQLTLMATVKENEFVYHALVWLDPRQPHPKKAQGERSPSIVELAGTAGEACGMELHCLEAVDDPLYRLVRFVEGLKEDRAVLFAQTLAGKLGNITTISRVIIGASDAGGVKRLDPLPVDMQQ